MNIIEALRRMSEYEPISKEAFEELQRDLQAVIDMAARDEGEA
jgi:hypothetical protein